MSHAARDHGNVTVFSGSDSSFVFFLILFMQIQKKKIFFLLLASHSLLFLCPLYSPCNVISPFALFPPSSSSWLCFRQASPCQSVGAMCRSGTSLRETVDWTMWRSASAGDAACRGLMSSWRYAEDTHTHRRYYSLRHHWCVLTSTWVTTGGTLKVNTAAKWTWRDWNWNRNKMLVLIVCKLPTRPAQSFIFF